eukprot:UN28169
MKDMLVLENHQKPLHIRDYLQEHKTLMAQTNQLSVHFSPEPILSSVEKVLEIPAMLCFNILHPLHKQIESPK